MEKIPTIFERNWETNRKVNEQWAEGVSADLLKTGIATEKIDGMNVRLTVRMGTAVRLEKRRNPDKSQKAAGIKDPWYVDADLHNPADAYLFDALNNTDLANIPDGEWPAEAFGEKIQGNPLKISGHTLFFFSLATERERITFSEVPLTYLALREWLHTATSKVHPGSLIEGLVWHLPDGRKFKIKRKDFA